MPGTVHPKMKKLQASPSQDFPVQRKALNYWSKQNATGTGRIDYYIHFLMEKECYERLRTLKNEQDFYVFDGKGTYTEGIT